MASPWADQPVRTLPCNQPLGSTGDSATANAALLDSATSYHVSTAISSQQGSKNTSSLLRPTSLSRQQTVPSSSYTAGSRQAAFDDSEYHLAVPFPQWHQQKATGSSVAGLEGGRYGQKPVDHPATNLVGLPRPFRSYHEKLHFVSTLSTCINSITLFTSRDVDQIFQLLGRQLRRKDTQYNRTVDDASLSHMSLIVFLDKGKLAKEYWDSADVVEELEGIYPGLLKVLRFPSWDAGQHDLLQICIKVLPKVPPVGRYGIESFEWFIWHVANQQLYQGHYSSVSGDVDVFWGGLQPEGYTNVPLEIKPGFSTSWFRDNISALSVGPFIDVAAQASRVKPENLRLLTFDGCVLPGELCVVCKHKTVITSAVRTPGDTYCCRTCHTKLFEKCHICTEFVHKPRLALVTCGHKFCDDCLIHAFESGTRSLGGFPPRCCEQDLSLQSHRKTLPPKVVSAYIRLLQERAEKNDIVCATPACEKRVIKEHCIINQWGICAECHDLTCSRCGNLESDHQIASDLRTCPVSEDDMQVLELADANKWKACPKCGTLIERSEGCNSMACRCGQEFCYTCGDAYEVERSCECPVHYEGDQFYDGNGEGDVTDLWDPAVEQLRSTLQQSLHRLEEDVGSEHPLAAAQLHEFRESVVGRGLALAAETRLSVWVGRILERDHNQWLHTAEERLEIFTVDDLSRLLQW